MPHGFFIPAVCLIASSILVFLVHSHAIQPLPGTIVAALALILVTTLYFWALCALTPEYEEDPIQEQTFLEKSKETLQYVLDFFKAEDDVTASEIQNLDYDEILPDPTDLHRDSASHPHSHSSSDEHASKHVDTSDGPLDVVGKLPDTLSQDENETKQEKNLLLEKIGPLFKSSKAGVILVFRLSDTIEFLHLAPSNWWQGMSTQTGEENLKEIALEHVSEATGLTSDEMNLVKDFSEEANYDIKDLDGSKIKVNVTYWLAEVSKDAKVSAGCEWKSFEDSLEMIHNEDMSDVFKKSAKYLDKTEIKEDEKSKSRRSSSSSAVSISTKSMSTKSISINGLSTKSFSTKSIRSRNSLKSNFNKTVSVSSMSLNSVSSSNEESEKYEKLSKKTDVPQATFGTWYNDADDNGLRWRVLEKKKQTVNITLTVTGHQKLASEMPAESDIHRGAESEPDSKTHHGSMTWTDYLILGIKIVVVVAAAVFYFTPQVAKDAK